MGYCKAALTQHRCCNRMLTQITTAMTTDFEIELYWEKEGQWWYLDRQTTLHEFWYTSDDKLSGECIASWLNRKNVKCKWRRMSEYCAYSNDGAEEKSASNIDRGDIAAKTLDSHSQRNDDGRAPVIEAVPEKVVHRCRMKLEDASVLPGKCRGCNRDQLTFYALYLHLSVMTLYAPLYQRSLAPTLITTAMMQTSTLSCIGRKKSNGGTWIERQPCTTFGIRPRTSYLESALHLGFTGRT